VIKVEFIFFEAKRYK